MQQSNLRLENYFVERLSWEIAPGIGEVGGDDGAPAWATVLSCEDIRCQIEQAVLEAPRRAAYRLILDYAAQPGKSPYAWSVALIGYFELDADFPDGDVSAFMDAGAPAMLYGAAREALASALGRGPYVAPLLPTVHFANLQPAATPAVAAVEDKAQPAAKPKRQRKKKPAPAEVESE